jgi:hypothetical protein
VIQMSASLATPWLERLVSRMTSLRDKQRGVANNEDDEGKQSKQQEGGIILPVDYYPLARQQ